MVDDSRQTPARTHMLATLLIVLLLALAMGAYLQKSQPNTGLGGDGHYFFLQSFSLLFDFDLDFSNQYEAFGDPFDYAHTEVTRGIGNALLWAPFMYLGSFCAWLDGSSNDLGWLKWGLRSGTLFYAWLSVLLMAAGPAMRVVSPALRRLVTIALAISTPLWAYSVTFMAYNHVLVLFLVALFWWLLDAGDSFGPKARAVALGTVLSLLLTTRPEYAAVVLLLAEREPPTYARRGLWVRTLGAAVMLPLVQSVLFAHAGKALLPSEGFLQLSSPQWLDLLFSPRNGFVAQQPLVGMGLVGLLLPWPNRRTGLASIIVVGIVLWVNASAWDVWGSYSFGARRCLPLLPFVAVGLANIFAWLGARRHVGVQAVRGAQWLFAVLCVAYRSIAWPRPGSSSWSIALAPRLSFGMACPHSW